jgi:hypothetical protein
VPDHGRQLTNQSPALRNKCACCAGSSGDLAIVPLVPCGEDPMNSEESQIVWGGTDPAEPPCSPYTQGHLFQIGIDAVDDRVCASNPLNHQVADAASAVSTSAKARRAF